MQQLLIPRSYNTETQPPAPFARMMQLVSHSRVVPFVSAYNLDKGHFDTKMSKNKPATRHFEPFSIRVLPEYINEARPPNELSDVLSTLISHALKDLVAAEESPLYEIEMDHGWHISGLRSKSPCSVCLAGTVMAGRLKTSATTSVSPSSFDRNTAAKLDALDFIRQGRVITGHVVFEKAKAEDNNIDSVPYQATYDPDPAEYEDKVFKTYPALQSMDFHKNYIAYAISPVEFKLWLAATVDKLRLCGL